MLTRGKLADQTGCNIETIRYYERVGLLPEPSRTPAGYRIYDGTHIRVLNFIQRAKTLGFSGEQLRELLELFGPTNHRIHADIKYLAEQHIVEINRKIRDLRKLKKKLTAISSFYDDSGESAETCLTLVSLFNEQVD